MFDECAEDGPMTAEQETLVSKLSKAELDEIDSALLKNICGNWRKVARVIATTIMDFGDRFNGVPDVFYAKRIQLLRENNLFESQGNLKRMRYSEIKYPDDKNKS